LKKRENQLKITGLPKIFSIAIFGCTDRSWHMQPNALQYLPTSCTGRSQTSLL